MTTIATVLAAMLAMALGASAFAQSPKVATLEQAQRLAATHLKAAADRCPALVGGAFSSGVQAVGATTIAMRVRCTDDAYLALVDRATGNVETMRCRVARARYGAGACRADSNVAKYGKGCEGDVVVDAKGVLRNKRHFPGVDHLPCAK